MTLEDAINDALRRGELVHLSVWSTGKGFKASFASASRAGGYETAEAMDPIVAMMRAIGAAPMVRLPKSAAMGKSTDLAVEIDDPALL